MRSGLVFRRIFLWNFCIIFTVFVFKCSCDQLFNFGLQKDPCELECNCESWKSTNALKEGKEFNDRFTVNCTGMKFGLFQGITIPKPLPYNTTDLVVTDYFLRQLSINSFDSNSVPLNPQLISLVVRKCHMIHLSYETFYSNTLQSLHHVDISSNALEELHEKTFYFLYHLETILLSNNNIRKVAKHTFRNLDVVKIINISSNWLKELHSEALHNVPSLEILDLSDNLLERLPWKMISHMLSLKVLGLKGNPWHCSCEMRNILLVNRSLLVGSQAVCQFPENLQGTLLEDLTNDTFSYCLTSEQDVNITQFVTMPMRHIMTLLCIILGCLYLYMNYYRVPNTQHENPSNVSETQSGSPAKERSGTGISLDTQTDYVFVRNIKYNIENVLYRSEKVTVYQGLLDDGRQAAIKKRFQTEVSKELNFLLYLSKQDRPHPNVIQYLDVIRESDFTYLVLEFCPGDLMTAMMDRIDGFDVIAEPKDFLTQLTSGICFLHNHGIQHRDIKPQNIRWTRTKHKIVLVISDLDLGHYSKKESSHKLFGTTGWTAPELCTLQESRKDAVDIFSLGCVFYFILTREHPFGPILDPKKCQSNINSLKYKPSLDALYVHHSEHVATMAEDLISRMIASKASDRINACKMKKHPFLMSKDEMLSFFTRIGDRTDVEGDSEVTNFKEKMEENASAVFDGSWLEKLHKSVRRKLKGFNETDSTHKICKLLRAVRNQIEHFETLENAGLRNKIFSGSKHGVAEYFMKTFPRLVPYTYQVLTECDLNI